MNTEIEKAGGSALAVTDTQSEWNSRQAATLQQMGLEKAGPADLAVFLHQCQRTGLDPFSRQIYMIGRGTKNGMRYTIQTGIDGYRLIADRADARSGGHHGYEDTLWCGEDGVWRDVWIDRRPPTAAKVCVVRDLQRFSAVALMSEYCQTDRQGKPTPMWQKMPATMLAKCAEALALRKAYPQDLSGIYTTEEMAQASNREQHTQLTPQLNVEQLEAKLRDLDDVEGLRGLWVEASQAHAPKEFMDEILAKVKAVSAQDQAGEPEPLEADEVTGEIVDDEPGQMFPDGQEAAA